MSTDPAIGRELTSLDKQLKADQDNQRLLCRRMFGNSNGGAAANRTKPVGEVNVSDEDYEEIAKQLTYFKKSESDEDLILPTGMGVNDLRVARVVANKIGGLQVKKINGKEQWKIVKEKK